MSMLLRLLSFIPRKFKKLSEEHNLNKIRKQFGSLTKHYFNDPRIDIGDFTYGIPYLALYTDDYYLKIGKYCCISNNVEIIIGGQHHYENISQYAIIPVLKTKFPFDYYDKPSKPVSIGNDVWIGRNAVIMQGVTIGDGAVIGANAVVAKDIPPYAIAVGNPVRIIRYRFDPKTIDALLRIKWWDWPDEKVSEFMPLIMSSSVKEFIDRFYE